MKLSFSGWKYLIERYKSFAVLNLVANYDLHAKRGLNVNSL